MKITLSPLKNPAVFILLVMVLASACSKKESAAPDPTASGSLRSTYTHKLDSSFKWNASSRFWATSSGIDTTFSLSDTTFAVTVINDSTIHVFGKTLSLYSQSFSDFGVTISIDTNDRLTYGQVKDHYVALLNYYYKTGVIKWYVSESGLGGGQSWTYMH